MIKKRGESTRVFVLDSLSCFAPVSRKAGKGSLHSVHGIEDRRAVVKIFRLPRRPTGLIRHELPQGILTQDYQNPLSGDDARLDSPGSLRNSPRGSGKGDGWARRWVSFSKARTAFFRSWVSRNSRASVKSL